MAKKSQTTKEVIDLDLSMTERKVFRFNKDDTRTVSLNVSDMGIMARLTDTYPKLAKCLESAQEVTTQLSNGETDEDALNDLAIMGNKLKEIDAEMRGYIDYIFDAEVSKAAAPDGSMYDIFNGQFRFEYILSLLLGYCGETMSAEFEKLNEHISEYTNEG